MEYEIGKVLSEVKDRKVTVLQWKSVENSCHTLEFGTTLFKLLPFERKGRVSEPTDQGESVI